MYLCLSRKTGESISIGDHIEIVVERIQGNKVRLAIRAPLDMPVSRTRNLRQEDALCGGEANG